MARNKMLLVVGVLVIAFAGFSLLSFKQNLTPYVSYAQAQAQERVVQVAGGLEKETFYYDDATETLHFTLLDPDSDAAMHVRYKGLKPANFEDAISIVAIGRYDPSSEEFHADKLLVKCPSKYQGAEVKQYS
jgi:cytochrome c-type biogenesis protein CcmE